MGTRDSYLKRPCLGRSVVYLLHRGGLLESPLGSWLQHLAYFVLIFHFKHSLHFIQSHSGHTPSGPIRSIVKPPSHSGQRHVFVPHPISFISVIQSHLLHSNRLVFPAYQYGFPHLPHFGAFTIPCSFIQSP